MRVNLADSGPSFGQCRGQRPRGGGQEVTAAAGGMVPLRQQRQKAAGTGGMSVPPDLDRRELPEVRLAHVQQVTEGRGAPLERGQLVPRGATGCQKTQGLGQRRASQLGAGQSTRARQPGRAPCRPTSGSLVPTARGLGQACTFTSMPPWERCCRARKG